MSLTRGAAFGRYTIEALLGEGGMGEVYRAWDTRLQRKVALKVLHRAAIDSATDSQGIARMLREARAAAALNHPNVVAIFDVGEEAGAAFLVMELIEGKSLRHFIGADVPMSTRTRWLLDIARALATAHRAGLVHRDVKPENVMLRDDGVLKVLDFGIAKRATLLVDAHGQTLPAELATLTGQGMLVGTLAYMAPEQVHGDDLDGRADQFAWGVLAYELLSGKLPFGAGKDALGLVASILSKEAPPLEGSVPETLQVLVRRALSKSRDDRFASMDEVVAALESQITGERSPSSLRDPPGGSSPTMSSSRGPSTAQVQVLSVSRRRGRWPAALGAIALLGVGIVVATLRRSASPPAPPAAGTSAPAIAASVPAPTEPPGTQNAKALAAYREGLQGFRDAAWGVSHTAFQNAVALDPTFAAAYLRLAQTNIWYSTPNDAREAYNKAISLRASLGERDRALLDALEPILQRDPPDPLEMARRFETMSPRYPTDAEFALGEVPYDHNLGPVKQLERSERCLELDPHYADCWQHKSAALARLGRMPEALAAFDRCLEVSPGGNDCVWERSQLFARTGQCTRLEEDTRRRIAGGKTLVDSYQTLANTLYAMGRPMSAVRAAIAQARLQMTEPRWADEALLDDSRLALLTGDLEGAVKVALKLKKNVADTPTEDEHAAAADLLVALYQEMGKEMQAARAADEFLAERDVWSQPLLPSVWFDPTVAFLKAKLRAGIIARDEYTANRAAWMRTAESKLSEEMRGAAWLVAYARPASTIDDAKEALECQPKVMSSLHYSYQVPGIDAMIGKIYLLAGRFDEALPYLTRAVADCITFGDLLGYHAAQYHLGQTLEARGDKPGACTAYQRLLARWPSAGSSVTMKAAAARAKALGCSRSP